MKELKKLKSVILVLLLLSPQFALAEFAKTYDALYNPLPADQLFCPTIACDLFTMFLLITRNILQLIPYRISINDNSWRFSDDNVVW